MQAADSPIILIVEDEPKLARLMSDYLTHGGYRTHCLANGLEVIPWVREHPPALILLDLMLPGKNGMDICRELRGISNIPIIMVTARVEEIDRLLGLELGADDYICKPFSPREVVARVKTVLRRTHPPETQAAPGSELVLDPARYEATLNGSGLDLTPVEFRLLTTLSAHPGRVYSRNYLLDEIYEDHRVVSDRTVDSHVKNLRKKMEEIAPDREIIRSIYGVGYKLEL